MSTTSEPTIETRSIVSRLSFLTERPLSYIKLELRILPVFVEAAHELPSKKEWQLFVGFILMEHEDNFCEWMRKNPQYPVWVKSKLDAKLFYLAQKIFGEEIPSVIEEKLPFYHWAAHTAHEINAAYHRAKKQANEEDEVRRASRRKKMAATKERKAKFYR